MAEPAQIEDLEAYAEAVSRAVGLAIPADTWASVRIHLRRLLEEAALVMDFPLPEHIGAETVFYP